LEKQQISLVLPCYKPESGWVEKVLLYYNAISEKLPETELFFVMVNDGSPGIVAEDIRSLQEKIKNFSYYSYEKNRGKGYALRYGVARVITSSVIYSDLDLPYIPDSFLSVAGLRATHDVVIGIKHDRYYDSVPAWRKRISKLLQQMIALFFPGIVTTDTQCGLKGFKGKAKDVFLATRINNYLFDLEFIVAVSRRRDITAVLKEIQLGENVSFVPVSLTTIFRELLNFLRIIFIRNKPGPVKQNK
jgi:glycosyltransferase involved in cell wall biosynthesis